MSFVIMGILLWTGIAAASLADNLVKDLDFHTLNELYKKQGEMPDFADLPTDFAAQATYFEWHLPRQPRVALQVTLEFADSESVMTKYSFEFHGHLKPHEARKRLSDAIASGTITPLIEDRPHREITCEVIKIGDTDLCRNHFGYRKVTLPQGNVLILVSNTGIGRCVGANPSGFSILAYFISLKPNDTVETVTASNLFSGDEIVDYVEAGIKLKILKIQGRWAAVKKLDGKSLAGWILLMNLKPA